MILLYDDSRVISVITSSGITLTKNEIKDIIKVIKSLNRGEERRSFIKRNY